MKSVDRIAFSFALLAFTASAGAARGQAAEEEPGYVAQPIVDGVYMLSVPGVPFADNLGLVETDEGNVLIDSGFPQLMESEKQAIDTLNDLPLLYVVNTHYHHVNGNAAFTDEAEIIGHSSLPERMSRRTMMYNFAPAGPYGPADMPERLIDDRLTLTVGQTRFEIVHFPNAHTDGDLVIGVPSRDLFFTGDIFVNHLGLFDFANGGTLDAYVETIDELADWIPADGIVIPGHGDAARGSDVREYADLLRAEISRLEAMIESGATLEEIRAAGVPARWRKWADKAPTGPMFLTNLYIGITGETDRSLN